MPQVTAIQVRRGTAAQWTTANPLLLAGEIGFESDTNKVKIGDGATAWAALKYLVDPGSNSGVATLDANGKVPTTQLPNLAISDTSVVATQAAMLALTAEVGDVAVRTDVGKTFILKASPATTLANWTELLAVGAPTTMTGADGTTAGASGYVPAPAATDNTKFLRGDGTFVAMDGGTP